MIKLIIQITRIIIAAIASLLFQSCVNIDGNFEIVNGNGDVTSEVRNLSEDFTSIEAKTGIEVIVTQENSHGIKIEADSNLHEHIITEVKDGKLKIYCDANFKNVAAKKVFVQMPIIEGLQTSSGASITNKNTIKATTLDLESSSGSQLKIEVIASEIICESSSGSEIILIGETNKLKADSSSGSTIAAAKLTTNEAEAEASSGSEIKINPIEKLVAKASSGATISYSSQPKTIEIKKSSGGEVRMK